MLISIPRTAGSRKCGRLVLRGWRFATSSQPSLQQHNEVPAQKTGEGGGNVILTDPDAKYTAKEGTVYMTGLQALVRLPIVVRDRDAARGHNTAGFISGYRGSPLGGYDQLLWGAAQHLAPRRIELQAAVNEEVAATAVWGSQQVALHHDKTVDGVFGIWYGKGPGVDRSGDAIKHANLAGTSALGGVLAVAGDDHACKSSTVPHHSEVALRDMNVPVVAPSSVAEVVAMGVIGLELSRYSGCWVALKVTSQLMDSGATVTLGNGLEWDTREIARPNPNEFEIPGGGLNLRLPDDWNSQEARLYQHKLPAVTAFWKSNGLDRRIFGVSGGPARLVIMAAGTSALDAVEALQMLGIDQRSAEAIGLCVFKVGLVWPLEPSGVSSVTEGAEEVLVVEEKRAVIEPQLKDILYNRPKRPRVVGKRDPAGARQLGEEGELTVLQIARAISGSVARVCGEGWDVGGWYAGGGVNQLGEGANFFAGDALLRRAAAVPLKRQPYFCAGCPHNTSTKVPEGARVQGGIGCHTLALFMGRFSLFSQMGGEGAAWIGLNRYLADRHTFVNMGDGTYVHSGVLSIRACVAANANMTFRILYNGAVAMTGGQRNDTGDLASPQNMARQLLAEGVKEVVIVTDRVEKYTARWRGPGWLGGRGGEGAEGVRVVGREGLGGVERRLRGVEGVTAIVYDQECATEKRRARKRGSLPPAPHRVLIHPAVCEGCGDCGQQSNCVALRPEETPLGRKRTVSQEVCNSDLSCLKGFCPSFISVSGPALRPTSGGRFGKATDSFPVPPPAAFKLGPEGWAGLVCGIGGTGVVTVGALLGQAALVEGLRVNVFDQIGLSQKNGAVATAVKIFRSGPQLETQRQLGGPQVAARIRHGGASVVLAYDLATAVLPQHLSTIGYGHTHVVFNGNVTMPGSFAREPDMGVPVDEMTGILTDAAGGNGRVNGCGFDALCRELVGREGRENVFGLGYAAQTGLLPVSLDALRHVIKAGRLAVEENLEALEWGRRAAHDLPKLQAMIAGAGQTFGGGGADDLSAEGAGGLDEIVTVRVRLLEAYQDRAYADRYRARVDRVREAEGAGGGGGEYEIAKAAARGYAKALAYKDEYEVARLHLDGTMQHKLRTEISAGGTESGALRLTYHLSPPLIAPTDPSTGLKTKVPVPGWLAVPLFRVLSGMRWVRNGPLDVFKLLSAEERRVDREVLAKSEEDCELVIRFLEGVSKSGGGGGELEEEGRRAARELLEVPLAVRGFGHVKERNFVASRARRTDALNRLRRIIQDLD